MSNPYIDPCDLAARSSDPGVLHMLRRLKVSIKWQPETVPPLEGLRQVASSHVVTALATERPAMTS